MSEKFSNTKKTGVYNKADGHCIYCGNALEIQELTIDHAIPRIRGGSRQIENLYPSCKKCNSTKHDLTISEFQEYLLKRISNQLKDTLKLVERYSLLYYQEDIEWLLESAIERLDQNQVLFWGHLLTMMKAEKEEGIKDANLH